MTDVKGFRPVAWTIPVHVTDHGRWLPDEPLQAPRIIAVVNAWRKPDDRKPKVFRDYDGLICLRVTIGGDTVFMDPGEHLVRLDLPQVTAWNTVTPEHLAELSPEEPVR